MNGGVGGEGLPTIRARMSCVVSLAVRVCFVTCVWATYFCLPPFLSATMHPQSALESELRELRGRLADMEQSSGSREDDLQREIASLRDKWQAAEVCVCVRH